MAKNRTLRHAAPRAAHPPAEVRYAVSAFNRLAYYDPLTRLPNRGMLQDRLEVALAASARSGLFGALFAINVRNFRGLNSAEGHEAGDQLLVQLATRLHAVVRDCDSVARQWGDEFLILVEDLAGDACEATLHARVLGERLCAAMDQPFDLTTHLYSCRISIGITLFGQHDTVDSALDHAALAREQVKGQATDCLCFFAPPMQSLADQRRILSAELEKALVWQQFCIYYQPQVDHRQRVVGVEALLRWQHPLRGLVPPGEFIPLAEATDLIIPIGLWVLQSACEQLKQWESQPYSSSLPVSVNVSARQFQRPDFVLQVKNALESSGANPERLKLELTESLVLENMDEVMQKMQQVRQLGVRFSMDDFGTGYSSLSYLSNLPLDQLKIDRSFVQKIPGKSSDEIIARTIIMLGQSLGMNVIAEGVETPEQYAFLARHGCNSYQGYLFSRPLPLDALEIYLQCGWCYNLGRD